MKNSLTVATVAIAIVLFFPAPICAQAPDLRSLSCFAMFTTTGAVGNTGVSAITGNVGTGTGAITGFVSPSVFNGNIFNADAVTTQGTADLTLLYNDLNNTVPNFTTHAPAFGSGETLFAGVYSIAAAGSVAGTLTLDAEGDSNAVFIFKFGGAFTTGAASTIILLNGAKAGNVFWEAEGAISMDAVTVMKGTLVSHNGAVSMGAGGTLDGRMLSTTGAVSVNVVMISGSSDCGCFPTAGISRWLGVDNNWMNSANWCGGIPDAATNVIIPSLCANYPVIFAGTAHCNNINIGTGASCIVFGAGIFSLSGAISNAGVFDITDGTLDLAGSGVSIDGSSFVNGTVKNLTISSGASSSIAAGLNIVSVKNNLSFLSSNNLFTTNGNLALLSTALLTASVTDITGNGTLSGNIIIGNASVERFIPASKKWRLLAINTEAGDGSKNTVQDNWMEGAVPGVTGGVAGYGMWVTSETYTALPPNFDAISYSPTIKWPSGNTYIGITDPTVYDIRSHAAYFTYVRGDRGCTATNGMSSTTVLRSFGNLAQGDRVSTIPSGASLLSTGNPYASAIDLRKIGFSSTGVINIYVWDPKLGGAYGLGGFQLLSRDPLADADFYVTPGGGSYGPAVTMNTIESGLGFFVEGSAINRNITFKETAKIPAEPAASFTAGNQQKLTGMLAARETDGSFTTMDGFRVRMDSSYQTALDANDARKFINSAENVAVMRDGVLLSLDYRNVDMLMNDTMLINMANMSLKDYRWTFTTINCDKPGRIIVLVDKFLGTETILNPDGPNMYDFTVTNNAGSYAAARFIIIFRQMSIVPLTGIALTGRRLAAGKISLNWNAENELNIDHYEIQTSSTGTTFISFGINTVATNNNGGSPAYAQSDASPSDGDNYYRIKAIGAGAQVQYSNIIKLSAVTGQGTISVYPNPVEHKTIQLFFTGMPGGNYLLLLADSKGQTIYRKNIPVQGFSAVKNISLSKNIPAGTYLLSVTGVNAEKTGIVVCITGN